MDKPSKASTDAEADAVPRKNRIEVEAVNPQDGSLFKVLLPDWRLRLVMARSLGQGLEARDLVPEILQYPSAIFEGLCQDADEPTGRGVGWRCYSGIPSKAFREDGTEVAPYPKQAFLVFITDGCVAYNWYWYDCDIAQPGRPINWQARFKTVLL